MEPLELQQVRELALRVWLKRLPAMPASWLPVSNKKEFKEEMLLPSVPRVLAASRELSAQVARARAMARVATVSRACRALAEAEMPASARLALQSKKYALTGALLNADDAGVLEDAAVQDALLALYAPGATPPPRPAVSYTLAGGDEAPKWFTFRHIGSEAISFISDNFALQMLERGTLQPAAGQELEATDLAVLRQTHVARYLAFLASAGGGDDAERA
jgi:hypothetical protein